MSAENEYEAPDIPNFQPSLSGATITDEDRAAFAGLKTAALQSFDTLEQKQLEAHVAISEVNQLIALGEHILTMVDKYAGLAMGAAGGAGGAGAAPAASGISTRISQATAALAGVRGVLGEAAPLLAGLGVKIPGLA